MRKSILGVLVAAVGFAGFGMAASAAVIPVANGDFEAAGSSGFSGDPAAIVGWTYNKFTGTPTQATFVGVQAPDTTGFTTKYAFFYSYGKDVTLEQELGSLLQANATYTLTIDVGRRSGGEAYSPMGVKLFAGTTELVWTSSSTNTVPAVGSPQTRSFTYEAPASPAAGFLKVQLADHSEFSAFDNVTLTETVAVPEPTGLVIVGLASSFLVSRRRRAA